MEGDLGGGASVGPAELFRHANATQRNATGALHAGMLYAMSSSIARFVAANSSAGAAARAGGVGAVEESHEDLMMTRWAMETRYAVRRWARLCEAYEPWEPGTEGVWQWKWQWSGTQTIVLHRLKTPALIDKYYAQLAPVMSTYKERCEAPGGGGGGAAAGQARGIGRRRRRVLGLGTATLPLEAYFRHYLKPACAELLPSSCPAFLAPPGFAWPAG